MPLDYSLHAINAPVQGNQAPAPSLPHYGGQKGLAEDTLSAEIVCPCHSVLACTADTKLRFELVATDDAGAIDPANSPVVINPGSDRYFTLAPGSYKLKTTAWA